MTTPAGVPAVPAPIEELELRGHLFMWHLQYTGDIRRGDMPGLIECHDDYRHGTDTPPVRTHTHSAPVPEEGWNWDE